MDKNFIVSKMVNIAEKNNIEAMKAAGIEESVMKTMIDQVKPQLFKIQSEILDTLVSEGIIEIKD